MRVPIWPLWLACACVHMRVCEVHVCVGGSLVEGLGWMTLLLLTPWRGFLERYPCPMLGLQLNPEKLLLSGNFKLPQNFFQGFGMLFGKLATDLGTIADLT